MAKTKKHAEASEGDKDKKKNTSLRLESKTLKALKLRAVQDDTSVQQIVETLIDGYLKTPRKKDR